jgi:hypothetical protein
MVAVWRAKTVHTADNLLTPDFFDRVAGHGLRLDDLVICTTDTKAEKHRHCVLVVTKVYHGRITVERLL